MKIVKLVIFICIPFLSFSQEIDSLEFIDTNYYHSPKKAVLLSAILPGSGHIYNHIHFKKGQKGKRNVFWKIPLFYSAIGYTAFSLIQNQTFQKDLKAEYNYRQNNNELALDERWSNYDTQGILSLTKEYEGKRDFSILLFGAAYLIQIIDAGIEAHFVSFDISQDLTFNIHPEIFSPKDIGIRFTLNFKNRNNSLSKYSKL